MPPETSSSRPANPWGPPIPNSGPLILGLGIASIVCSGCAPIGLVLGLHANKKSRHEGALIDVGQLSAENKSLVAAGRVCAVIGICLSSLSLAIWALYALLIGVALLTAA